MRMPFETELEENYIKKYLSGKISNMHTNSKYFTNYS